MVRTIIVAAACLCAAPGFAQSPAQAPQVDAAAVFEFDPDGGYGVPLTREIVRDYLSAPIAKPTQQQLAAAHARVEAAKQARTQTLAQEGLFAPLWDEEAFELSDGTVRPMTAAEKAVFRELDAAKAGEHSLSVQRTLSEFSEVDRSAWAEALGRLLDAGIYLAARRDGYLKVGDDWMWMDWEDGRFVASARPDAQTEIALLRYDVVRNRVMNAVSLRQRAALNTLLISQGRPPIP